MFSGMVWIARSGAPWRDLSERYGSCIFRKAHGKAVQK
jgi:transposase